MGAAANAGRDPIPARAGIGLRSRHHREVLEGRPDVAWFEAHTENYLGGGAAPRCLEAVRRDHPVSLHGVGLSLGGASGLDRDHLARIAGLVRRIEPGLVSEHLSWSGIDGLHLADLLPLPMTEEALDVVCRNVEAAQEALGRAILVENPSSYLRFRHSTIPEWEFLAEVARRTGCGILCDVNNIHVSAANHGWDAATYLAALPVNAVGEVHVAGHARRELGEGRALLIDDHGSAVPPAVWQLCAAALARFGPLPVLVEWDTAVPELDVLLVEAGKAAALIAAAGEGRHADAA